MTSWRTRYDFLEANRRTIICNVQLDLITLLINFSYELGLVIISPNEVFGDIMVLASPPRPPPVDPDDVNTLTQNIFKPISFKFYMWVDTPLRYFAIEI